MARRLSLSLGLFVVRSFQILGSFIPGAMNGWLLYHLYANGLVPSNFMLVLEILITAIFVHSLCSLFIWRAGRQSKGTVWIVASVCFDVVFLFANVTMISLLSFAGLPSNCVGLTTSLWSTARRGHILSPAYSTPAFSDEQDGREGGLDKFCNLERGFFFCAILMILLYILSIILSICCVFRVNYTRNCVVKPLLDEREESRIEYKLQEQEHRPQPTSSTSGPSPMDGAPQANYDVEAAMFASMSRPTMPPSSNSFIPSSSRNLGVNSAASSQPTPRAYSTSNHDPNLDRDSSEIHANMAMISDGSRYDPGSNRVDSSQLPPYSPGNQRTMSGHGSEDNNTLLSDYVKGETRAQDMKDAGNI